MIPYFELRTIALPGGPTLSVFGLLVVTGIAVGVAFAFRRARRLGVPANELSTAMLWALGAGFPISHAVEVIFYRPEQLARQGPVALLQFWNGLSSFGGFFGAFLGLAIYFAWKRKAWLVQAEILLQALVVGWVFGRLGCTLVHDHVGRRSDFALAVRFPDGPRHDLGLYELLYTVAVLLPAVLTLNRRPRPPGATLAAIVLLYAPARFLADFLRDSGLPGADLRYSGLTPAQYGCLVSIGIGLYFLQRVWLRRG